MNHWCGYLHVSYYSNSQKPSTENPFEDDVLTPPTFFPFQDMGAEVTKSLFNCCCDALYCFSYGLLYPRLYLDISVRGIGIVLDYVCNITYIYMYVYIWMYSL